MRVPSLHVTTATTGVEVDPDGYAVSVDGGPERGIGLEATVAVAELSDGPHTVELRGLAANCAVQGSNPRTAQVSAGSTAEVAFAVECRPTTGAIQVRTTTTGTDPDEDGYVVSVEGASRDIGPNTTLTYESVPAGTRVVELLGIAPNCTATGPTLTRVTVVGGETVEVSFAIGCAARPPEVGPLRILTETTGPSPDPDGYAASVDGGPPVALPATGSALLEDIPVGTRSVALSGLAANCQVQGENPRSATVTGTEVAVLTFAVVCAAPPPSAGTLRITTATAGDDPDPDGYAFALDGGDLQPIGRSATVSVANLAAGPHALALSGVADNCSVAGDNPRTVTVAADGVVETTFTVSCVPGTGSIATTTATTGESLDPDGYAVRVDGGAGEAISVNGTVTRAGLKPGDHVVRLDNVAPNCQVQGDNPRTVVVSGNATTAVTFRIVCAATTGSLRIAVSGLPSGADAEITVTGPGGYSAKVVGTTTLPNLTPGNYTVAAAEVTVGGDRYRPSAETQQATVAAGESPEVAVTYSRADQGSVNLRIAGMYLTQGSQRPDGSVPLVRGREGYLRVFVTASAANGVAPPVRVRAYRNGSLISTLEVNPPGASTPTVLQESPLSQSWNVRIPGDLIRPGLALLAEVDPDDIVAESDEQDNAWPTNGQPLALEVRPASTFAMRLVPVQAGPAGLVGEVSTATIPQFVEPARRRYPLADVDVDLHALFTSSAGPLEWDDGNGAWSATLQEVDLLRVIEATDRSYYGVVRIGYGAGIVGLGYIGYPAAIGYDLPSDAGLVTAHELGHTWGRLHAPCGGPSGTDPGYPYPGGAIGVWGLNLVLEALVEPTRTDIMGYCSAPWISDYTYTGVMDFRERFQAAEARSRAAAAPVQPALVVWGRIENGRPVLEPAFLVPTRPVMPSRPGPYRLEGVTAAGARLLSLSFAAVPVADARQDAEHFAFALPLTADAAAGLSSLRLTGPAGTVAASRTAAARAGEAPAPSARSIGSKVEVTWDAAAAPMVMVRDPRTGEVLAFGRRGRVEIPGGAGELELHLSDGVRSRPVRVRVGR